MNAESILLGAWLRGEHLEDIKTLDTSKFGEQVVIEKLQQGVQGLEIGLELSRVKEFADLMSVRADALYKQAYIQALRSDIYQDIANMKDLSLIRDKIDRLSGVTEEDLAAVEISDPAIKLAEEFSAKAQMRTVKWDKLPTLNNMTEGIKRKEMTAVAARPSVGKSAFGLQVAMGVQEAGEKVLYFPLEMSAMQTYTRLLIGKGYVTSKEAKTGRPADSNKLSLGLDYVDRVYKSRNFQIYEGECQIERIEAVIKREKPFLVVIDQLSQMRANRKFNSFREQFSYMTSTLKAIAMRENVAILLLCQLNRVAEAMPPTMANLKESGSIEEDSDNIILLHRFTPEQLENPEEIDWQNERPMLLNLAKQRDGEVGEFQMVFKPSRFMFYERHL